MRRFWGVWRDAERLAVAVVVVGLLSAAHGQKSKDDAAGAARKLGLDENTIERLLQQRAMGTDELMEFDPEMVPDLVREIEFENLQRERTAFRVLQDADEKGQIARDALLRAAQQLRRLREKAAPLDTAGVPTGPLRTHDFQPLTAGIEPSGWTWHGPGNIGGRTRCIALNPQQTNEIWAGSVAGGIWRTIDGGQSWGPVDDFMANLGVTCLVIDPGDPDQLFVGTGEGFNNLDAIRGAGIFRSTDGGLTWNQISSTDTDAFRHVNRLAISSDGSTILVATRDGIYRSANDGNTWIRVWTVDCADVDFHPTDPQRAIAGAISTGDAFFSTDGGTTWDDATFSGFPSGRVEVTYALADPQTTYASMNAGGGRLYRSTDGGESYQVRNDVSGYLGQQGWYDNVVWAGDPTDADLVLVGGIDLWRSTDGGATLQSISAWWQDQSAHADHHVIVAHPDFDGQTNRTVYFGNDGGIYRTDNVRTVGSDAARISGWTNLNNGYGVTQFYGAAVNSEGIIIGGAQDNGTLRCDPDDGTSGWSEMFGGDGGYCAADPDDPEVMYGEYVYLNIHRSDDAGQGSQYISGRFWNGSAWDWKPAPFHIPDARMQRANFIAPFMLDPNEPNRLLAGGQTLWRTGNARAAITSSSGPQWEAIKPSIGTGHFDAISAIDVADHHSDVVWVGHNNGRVYRTTNGTADVPTWQRVDENGFSPLPNRYCHRIAISPHDQDTVYVTFGGFTANNVWQTTDGGQTWRSVSEGLPECPVRAICVHPDVEDFIYLGTEVGLFASDDGGATWSPTNEGPTNCSVDELIWMNHDELVAVTHGRGIFSTKVEAEGSGPDAADELAELRRLLDQLAAQLQQLDARLRALE